MHAATHNLQGGIHDTLDFKHKMFQGKHVKLSGELLSLREKLPSLREKLPSFAENLSVQARTYIDFVSRFPAVRKAIGQKLTAPRTVK